MRKILLIIQREYITRVKKPVFLILTLLGPLFYVAIFAAPVLLSKYSDDTRTVYVLDESGYFKNQFQETNNIRFYYEDPTFVNEGIALKLAGKTSSEYFLIIPEIDIHTADNIRLIGNRSPGLGLESTVSRQLSQIIEDLRFEEAGIDKNLIERLRSKVGLNVETLGDSGEIVASSSSIASTAGMVSGFLIYIFVFMYGSMVFQGVQEEKNSRIVEVIVSSVRPFQLMMGKITGVALVGLTQLLLWVILSFILFAVAMSLLSGNTEAAVQFSEQSAEQEAAITNFMGVIEAINVTALITAFLFYFLGGYLIYSALFAAVGAAVDNNTESQQFMFPLTIPLIFTLISVVPIADDPNGALAYWLSIIPFTSPVAMMVRIPFGVDSIELLTSVILLIGGFLFTTWIAAKIYRTGILMYGKKISYKELYKWLTYRD